MSSSGGGLGSTPGHWEPKPAPGYNRPSAHRPVGPVNPRPGPPTVVDWLLHHAVERPDATFLAERDGDGWRTTSYADAARAVSYRQ